MPPDVFRLVCSVLKPHMPDAYDATGRAGVPLELKVLGYLRVLGRGWYFDDVAESTGMSEETARVSFHQIAAEVAYGELGRLHLDTLSDDELTVTLKEFEEQKVQRESRPGPAGPGGGPGGGAGGRRASGRGRAMHSPKKKTKKN